MVTLPTVMTGLPRVAMIACSVLPRYLPLTHFVLDPSADRYALELERLQNGNVVAAREVEIGDPHGNYAVVGKQRSYAVARISDDLHVRHGGVRIIAAGHARRFHLLRFGRPRPVDNAGAIGTAAR